MYDSGLNIIKFGTAGWSYEDWYGTVYPDEKKGFNPLEFVIRYLDTIEINSTFYHPPSPSTSKNWAIKANAKKNFTFTVKLWERFTHKRESHQNENVKIFKKSIDPLKIEDKIGALLVQFPWSYKDSRENRENILWIASEFKEYNPCIELRNSDWIKKEIFEIFAENGISFVNIDQPEDKSSVYKTAYVTGNIGYFRLHGRNKKNWFKKNTLSHEKYDYLYNSGELNELSDLIKKISAKVKTTYVIANNHFMGSAFKNSIELKNIITKEKLPIPSSVLKRFPDLKNISSVIDYYHSEKQKSLF